MVELIPPERISQEWPPCRELIEPAMARSLFGVVDVEYLLLRGDLQLWRICINDELTAAALTDIRNYPSCRVLQIFACGGRDFARWRDEFLIDALPTWARRHGCQRMAFIGRRGWSRVMPPDWRITQIEMQRSL